MCFLAVLYKSRGFNKVYFSVIKVVAFPQKAFLSYGGWCIRTQQGQASRPQISRGSRRGASQGRCDSRLLSPDLYGKGARISRAVFRATLTALADRDRKKHTRA